MTLAHGQTPCKPIDTVGIHEAIGDQSKRACDEIGPHIPLRRAWTGLWMAAATRPKTGSLGSRSARIETNMSFLRRLRGTDGPTVNAGRSHRRKEPPVEARIATA